MFYCPSCATQQGWPRDTLKQSRGRCEVCGQTAVCNDLPSSQLPLPAGTSAQAPIEPPPSRYWVKCGDGPWAEVSMDQFISAEQGAGFRRTIPGYGLATGGFGGNNIHGVVTGMNPSPGDYSYLPELAAVIAAGSPKEL